MHTHGYIAIRKDTHDGYEWMDTESFALLCELTEVFINSLAHKIPDWHKSNPVQRIVRCTITTEE